MGRLGRGDQAVDQLVAADGTDRADGDPGPARCPADHIHGVVTGPATGIAGLVLHQLEADEQQALGAPVLITVFGHDRLQPRLVFRRQIVRRGTALRHLADGPGSPDDAQYIGHGGPALLREQDQVRPGRRGLEVVGTPGQVAWNAGDGADQDQGGVPPGDRPHRRTRAPGQNNDLVQFSHLRAGGLGCGRGREDHAGGQGEDGNSNSDEQSHVNTFPGWTQCSNSQPLSEHLHDLHVMWTRINPPVRLVTGA